MPYFTSWDVNTYLSLLSWGLPEDVVKIMMKMTKKAHRDFTQVEAMTYWVSNSPKLESRTVNYGPETKEFIFYLSVSQIEWINTFKKSK